MIVASGVRTCSGRHLRRLATLALVLVMLGAVASRAQASQLRQLARSTTSFASDGERYAAWQLHAGAPIVVLDTLTGSRDTIAPAGCELMRDQGEYGEPSTTAADGRFLLDCETPARVRSQEVLDLGAPGAFVMLPNGAGFALSRPWTALGTRYVQGTAAPEECSHSAGEHEPCIALFDLATGAVSYRPPSQVLNLDLPGAPQICPALRASLRAQLRQVLPEQLAFQNGVFAHPTANGHNIRIERCNGRSTLLRGPSEPAAEPGGVRPSEPRSFDLGAGLLTWDTAHNANGAEMNEQSNARGTLSSYRLSTGRRRTWKLPPLALIGAPDIDGSGPEVQSPGVYGYSAHTANTVFWIATRTVKAAGVTSALTVETSSVYAASVSSVAVPARAQPASGSQPASGYRFEDLTVTRQVAADGKPIPGFVTYFRLNRALPFAPRGKFEGEEEGGPRLFAAYLSVDRVHEEGTTETIGDDASRHCYTEAIEVHAHEHQPRIGELVSVSLVIHGRAVINTRTRVRTRKMGSSVRKPNGVLLNQTDLPYEKAFGCL
jgi:hypothetical protein